MNWDFGSHLFRSFHENTWFSVKSSFLLFLIKSDILCIYCCQYWFVIEVVLKFHFSDREVDCSIDGARWIRVIWVLNLLFMSKISSPLSRKLTSNISPQDSSLKESSRGMPRFYQKVSWYGFSSSKSVVWLKKIMRCHLSTWSTTTRRRGPTPYSTTPWRRQNWNKLKTISNCKGQTWYLKSYKGTQNKEKQV